MTTERHEHVQNLYEPILNRKLTLSLLRKVEADKVKNSTLKKKTVL